MVYEAKPEQFVNTYINKNVEIAKLLNVNLVSGIYKILKIYANVAGLFTI